MPADYDDNAAWARAVAALDVPSRVKSARAAGLLPRGPGRWPSTSPEAVLASAAVLLTTPDPRRSEKLAALRSDAEVWGVADELDDLAKAAARVADWAYVDDRGHGHWPLDDARQVADSAARLHAARWQLRDKVKRAAAKACQSRVDALNVPLPAACAHWLKAAAGLGGVDPQALRQGLAERLGDMAYANVRDRLEELAKTAAAMTPARRQEACDELSAMDAARKHASPSTTPEEMFHGRRSTQLDGMAMKAATVVLSNGAVVEANELRRVAGLRLSLDILSKRAAGMPRSEADYLARQCATTCWPDRSPRLTMADWDALASVS